ncbi:MAG: hypothetical protein ACPGJU_04930 [Coraliomargarita sp.]
MRIAPLILTLMVICLLLGCGESPKQKALEAFTHEEIELGLRLLPTYCNTCHGVGNREMDEMLSPPLWAIRDVYLAKYPEPEAFVSAMVEFMQFPRDETALMPDEVQNYGLMTTVSLGESDLRATAIVIYAGYIERPSWYRDYEKSLSK